MSSTLVICYGYFGDHLFAGSIAKKLREEGQAREIDYVIGFPQVAPLLNNDPSINLVWHSGPATPAPLPISTQRYDTVIQLGPLSFIEPPCIEMQKLAGIQHPSANFTVYTDPQLDLVMEEEIDRVRGSSSLPVVAIMNNWQPKAFGFTKEEYAAGINIPYLGYGGRLRDIPRIVNALEQEFITIMVGAPTGVSQFDTAFDKCANRQLFEEASLLKYCDYFVGAEGGLANLAAGVGCKTILTSDFVHQLYGWNGVIRKIPEPKLGPRYYFPSGHIDLDPYLTDDEVIDSYLSLIKSK